MLDNVDEDEDEEDDDDDNEEDVRTEESRLMAVMANNLRIYPC